MTTEMTSEGKMLLATAKITEAIETLTSLGFRTLIIIEGNNRFSLSASGTSIEKLGLVELARLQIEEIVKKDAKLG